jgi:hemerythrin-like domain-containing protein
MMSVATMHAAAVTPRRNMYVPIHKALRAFMADTLTAVGRLDPTDEGEVAVTLDQTRSLLAALTMHLESEDRFVHAAMEARRAGSTAATGHDHVEHRCALAELHTLIDAVRRETSVERETAVSRLYTRLALFVAENLEHMNVEERENMAVLWVEYTDEELAALDAEIVAHVPPPAKAVAMRWMMVALCHAERVHMLSEMRRAAPPEVFEAVLAIARSNLGARDWTKLAAALDLAAARAA